MLSLLFGLSTLALLTPCRAASIGPITDLLISNANIAPDGFTREAVLAGGTFPGPLVKGNKASS